MPVVQNHDEKRGEEKVFIVDSSPLMRLGFVELLKQKTDYCICGEAESFPQAMHLIELLTPDLAVIEISLQAFNGFELIKAIKTHHPKLAVLAFSHCPAHHYAERAIRSGAGGYLMKHEPLEVVVRAIRTVLRGEIYLNKALSSKIIKKFAVNGQEASGSPMDLLSDRELEVFRFIGQGYGTREIAGKLCLSFRTIEVYRSRLKQKLNLQNGDSLLQEAIHWVKNEEGIQIPEGHTCFSSLS